jgi:hypothetical protein
MIVNKINHLLKKKITSKNMSSHKNRMNNNCKNSRKKRKQILNMNSKTNYSNNLKIILMNQSNLMKAVVNNNSPVHNQVTHPHQPFSQWPILNNKMTLNNPQMMYNKTKPNKTKNKHIVRATKLSCLNQKLCPQRSNRRKMKIV